MEQLRRKYAAESSAPEPFVTSLQNFINEAQSCAQSFFDNASYIERELPRVEMTDNLRQMTSRVCRSLTVTRDNVFSELQSWKGSSFTSLEFSQRVDEVIRLLSKDLNDLNVLVMSLRAQADIDQTYGLAHLLVGESATNIYQSFTRASEAAKTVGNIQARA